MNVLSLFDGMSCGRIALRELGIEPEHYYASEIDKFAISQTRLNFPDTIHLGDVTKWREWEIDWGTIDLILAGSPCFTAGTKVITRHGYKNIEDIVVGDEVLTHKNRFKKVLKVGARISDTVTLKAQGLIPTDTTINHPYYVRLKKYKWNNERRTKEKLFSEPFWCEVKDLNKDCFIGIPINNRNENPLNITKDEAMIIGRYIADGHTRKDKRASEGRPNDRYWQLILSIGDHKVKDFNSSLHYSCYKHSDSCHRIVFSNKRLVEIVESNCGVSSHTKRISNMLLNLPKDILKSLLDGYMDGDGCYTNNKFKITSVSKELIIGLSLAIAKVYGVHSNIEYTVRPKKTLICCREVNQSDTYTLYFDKGKRKQDNAIIIDGIVWLPFKSIAQGGKNYVYNLEVEDDNSYTANNAIVHNCQGFSFAGKQLAFDDPRSKLFFVFVDILSHVKALNPDVFFLLENVNMKKEHMRVITEYCGVHPVNINSNLVSAQNRNRWYWTNIRTKKVGLFGEIHSDIPQPKDEGILLRDILEEEVDEKYYLSEKAIRYILNDKRMEKRFTQIDGDKAVSLMAVGTCNNTGTFISVNGKAPCQRASVGGGFDTRHNCRIINTSGIPRKSQDKASCPLAGGHGAGNHSDMDLILQRPRGNNKGNVFRGKTPTLSSNAWEQNNVLHSIIQLNESKESGGIQPYQQNRVYHANGQCPALLADMSGRSHAILSVRQARNLKDQDGKSNSLLASSYKGSQANGMTLVETSSIRRLTPIECSRLQTVPDWYKWDCSDTQIYRLLGNGWTIKVIRHILSFLKKDIHHS